MLCCAATVRERTYEINHVVGKLVGRIMRISVVIPTLDRPRCLLDTVFLLQTQTAKADEIIVVDQTREYAPDDRAAITNLRRMPNVIYLTQEDPSASRARNAGLRRSSGDVVLFLDDDVRFDETLVARHLENYRFGSASGVAGQVRTHGKIVGRRSILSKIPHVGWLVFPFNYDKRCSVESARSANLSVRRDLAVAAGGMDERYERGGFREEADFCARLVARFGPLIFDPAAWIETLCWPSGGIRQTSRKYHLECEFYFIFKNVSAPLWPAHLVYTIYRQWYLRRNLRQFVCESIPLMCACAVTGWRQAGEEPRHLDRVTDSVGCFDGAKSAL
jgi:glycosyltransferase involved in cell wall biosynthesis